MDYKISDRESLKFLRIVELADVFRELAENYVRISDEDLNIAGYVFSNAYRNEIKGGEISGYPTFEYDEKIRNIVTKYPNAVKLLVTMCRSKNIRSLPREKVFDEIERLLVAGYVVEAYKNDGVINTKKGPIQVIYTPKYNYNNNYVMEDDELEEKPNYSR